MAKNACYKRCSSSTGRVIVYFRSHKLKACSSHLTKPVNQAISQIPFTFFTLWIRYSAPLNTRKQLKRIIFLISKKTINYTETAPNGFQGLVYINTKCGESLFSPVSKSRDVILRHWGVLIIYSSNSDVELLGFEWIVNVQR